MPHLLDAARGQQREGRIDAIRLDTVVADVGTWAHHHFWVVLWRVITPMGSVWDGNTIAPGWCCGLSSLRWGVLGMSIPSLLGGVVVYMITRTESVGMCFNSNGRKSQGQDG